MSSEDGCAAPGTSLRALLGLGALAAATLRVLLGLRAASGATLRALLALLSRLRPSRLARLGELSRGGLKGEGNSLGRARSPRSLDDRSSFSFFTAFDFDAVMRPGPPRVGGSAAGSAQVASSSVM